MCSWGGDERRRDLRLRLVAETVSVPGARQFVRDGLREWDRQALVDDAALCMTEMAANAALHSGSRFMDLHLRDLAGPVEIAVSDSGAVAIAEAVTPRTSPAMRGEQADLVEEPTTGRGLAIVSMLAKEWGVADEGGVRRVWAVIAEEEAGEIRPPVRSGESFPSDSFDQELPAGWKLVVVPGAPVDLSVRIDAHIDEVIRELQLVDSSPGSPSAELADVIERMISVPFARHTARASALEAAAAGRDRMDVRLPMPRAAADSVRGLLVALRRADDLCREHQLLTVPATPEMDLLREWYTDNMVRQLEDDAEPVVYDAWLAGRG